MNTKMKGYTLHIEHDECPLHPREDCDNFGKIYCWHPCYLVGDKNPYAEPSDFWEDKELQDRIFTWMYVYGLDHSGLAISCSSFNAVDPGGWDSGILGVNFATKEDVLKEYGDLSDDTKFKVNAHLNEEVEVLNDFYCSEHYAFLIEGPDGETIDCCGNFQCNDFKEMLDNMKRYVEEEYHPMFDKLYIQQMDSGMY